MLRLGDLELGPLVAQGGEGSVFEVLPGSPPLLGGLGAAPRDDLLFKRFKRPVPLVPLEELVAYPARLAAQAPGLASRAVSSSSWPLAAVAGAGSDNDMACGVVIARAPRPFWLAHREGPPRLATLSYLAGDPERIEVAYGLAMPARGSPERVAVAYALALLLEAWQAPAEGGLDALPAVVHGDLSAKNVLWSVEPFPAVYVLDCDGAQLVAPALGDEEAERGPAPRRATTPNWDDPACAHGQGPGLISDRYNLALIFLRCLGAANFPLQARQRAAAEVDIDLELPRWWRRLPDMAELWWLCEASLSVAERQRRPPPSAWSAQLSRLLDALGGGELAQAVRGAHQGLPHTLPQPCRPEVPQAVPDVVVHPVWRDRAAPTWQLVNPVVPLSAWAQGGGAGAVGTSGLRAGQIVRRGASMWGRAHRLALRTARSRGGRRPGLGRLARLLVVDVAALCIGLFLFGMIVSPWIGL